VSSEPLSNEIWRSLDQAALDRAYNNGLAVSDSAAIVADWEQRSAVMRARYPAHLDLPYGPMTRQRIDYLSADVGTPTVVFFHGGYWQSRSKDLFTFLAEGLLPMGFGVALVGYTLAPQCSLDGIVRECGEAINFLRSSLPALGAADASMILAGWSAGAHLAAMWSSHQAVKGTLAISGVYDLEPVRHTYLNVALMLEKADASRNSPHLSLKAGIGPMYIAAGSEELPELRRQSAQFAARTAAAGLKTQHFEVRDANHFSILERIVTPDEVFGGILQQLSRL
jgi:acetyl esterase/lipase